MRGLHEITEGNRAVKIVDRTTPATREERVQAWQYLVDTGLAYKLGGWYQKTASTLVKKGVCNDKP